MKQRIAFFWALFLSVPLLFAQPPETVYDGTLIEKGFRQNIDLALAGPYDIGFNFTFFGNSYDQFYVNANGMVMFTEPDGFYNNEVTIPDPAVPNNYIAAFWDNLTISDKGNVMYRTIGTSPNRKCIIQYNNMGFNPFPFLFGTFSVILYETTNIIQVQYRLILDPFSPEPHGASATIGLENADGTAGTLYAYHREDAVYTGDAISFTPDGPDDYTINDNALYDGVFLTSNLTLPDPGRPELVSPAKDAVTGTDHTFTWTASSNATNYYLLLGTEPNLAEATYANVGLNLSHTITGMDPDITYYWAVFAENSTAIAWCEISRFSTSSSPPLSAVPQTIWMEQGQDKTIQLNYAGGDESPKTAVITSLPARGALFQYDAGTRGSQITSVPATVTDAGRNVIYSASGSAGTGAGSFKFIISDDTGDSPEATIKVNVSPPGVPSVLYMAKNTNAEIQFDRLMADPAGKQDQFEVKVDGIPATITSVNLKTGDPYTIVLNLSEALTGTETVLISYDQGDVASTSGGLLLPFTDQPVTLRAQTINFTQSLNRKYSLQPFALSASATSGLGMTFASSDPAVAVITGSRNCNLRGVGTSAITARQAGNATYAPARFIKTLTVSKGDQTITFGEIPLKAVDYADFELEAEASSGLPVSFSASDPDVATVEGSVVHITGIGATVITASQAGSGLWNPAEDVQQELVVTATGIDDPDAPENSFIIYSAANRIYIQTLESQWDGIRGTITIFDITGKAVNILDNIEFSGNSRIEIPAGDLKGLYVVEIRSGTVKITKKVVIR